MSNLKLVSDSPTPLEQRLLDAARSEQPSAEHRARLRSALGIALPLSVPARGSTAPELRAGAGASTPAGSGLLIRASSSSAAKLALGLAGVALVGAFALMERGSASLPAPASRQMSAPAPPVEAEVAPAPAAVSAAPHAVVATPPAVERPTPARAPRADTTRAAPEDLSEQMRLIETARARVASGEPQAALEALDGYSARFPRGSFGQEASVLRIRALDRAGDSARASALAKSFLARFPNSPHVARLKPIAERNASR